MTLLQESIQELAHKTTILRINMAKINIKLPEPKQEYDFSNQKQINRALTTITEQLNSTFLDEVKQEQERFSFFMN